MQIYFRENKINNVNQEKILHLNANLFFRHIYTHNLFLKSVITSSIEQILYKKTQNRTRAIAKFG